MENGLGRSEHKRTKSFIDNFRKTIEESFHEPLGSQQNACKAQAPLAVNSLNIMQNSNQQNQQNQRIGDKQEKGIVKAFFYRSPTDK